MYWTIMTITTTIATTTVTMTTPPTTMATTTTIPTTTTFSVIIQSTLYESAVVFVDVFFCYFTVFCAGLGIRFPFFRKDGNILVGLISRQKLEKRTKRSLKVRKRKERSERKRTRCPTLVLCLFIFLNICYLTFKGPFSLCFCFCFTNVIFSMIHFYCFNVSYTVFFKLPLPPPKRNP